MKSFCGWAKNLLWHKTEQKTPESLKQHFKGACVHVGHDVKWKIHTVSRRHRSLRNSRLYQSFGK